MDPSTPAPILIGLLFDFPQADGGISIEQAASLGLEEASSGGRMDRGVTFVREQTHGLPMGTAAEVERGFARLDSEGVLAILGPTISDNGLIVRELADRAGLPCINFTGGAFTRSRHMFHYQVGSLEEEPILLAEHLSTRNLRRVAVVYDLSPVGRQYAQWFEAARIRLGVEVTMAVGQSAVAEAEPNGALAQRLRDSGADAVVYLGLGIGARALALSLAAAAWKVPVVANSALMFGYARKDWRADWEGWVYIDTIADDNPARLSLMQKSPAAAAGPMGVAAYDAGRILGEALAACEHLTRAGVTDAFERVKCLPASSGHPGTTMGFGCWDHGALKGPYLVLRSWRGGKTVQY